MTHAPLSEVLQLCLAFTWRATCLKPLSRFTGSRDDNDKRHPVSASLVRDVSFAGVEPLLLLLVLCDPLGGGGVCGLCVGCAAKVL